MTYDQPPKEGPENQEFDPAISKKFGEISFGIDGPSIVAGTDGPLVDEMAAVFAAETTKDYEWNVDSLGDLIGAVGPAKTLQDNIPALAEQLGMDGKELAIQWVEDSGLLEPVYRNFSNPEAAVPTTYDVAVITGGVRNWMQRRSVVLAETLEQTGTNVDTVLLAAGNRLMGPQEGDDLEEGDTEASYMKRVIAPQLEAAGLQVELLTPDTKDGNELAAQIAERIAGKQALLACNAGNWIQNGGQIARASGEPQNLTVVSDAFPVAKNNETPAVAQNPLTAVGIMARNLQEIARWGR